MASVVTEVMVDVVGAVLVANATQFQGGPSRPHSCHLDQSRSANVSPPGMPAGCPSNPTQQSAAQLPPETLISIGVRSTRRAHSSMRFGLRWITRLALSAGYDRCR